MSERRIRLGLLAEDASIHRAVAAVEPPPGYALEVVEQIGLDRMPSVTAGAGEFAAARVDIAFVDLSADPQKGLEFARALADEAPSILILAAGPQIPPELLLVAMRAGISEYLLKPVSAEDVAAALGRLSRRLSAVREPEPAAPSKVIGFLPVKGGTGTTTAAVNLAVAVHDATREATLLVDLDLELGGAALLLGLRPRFSFLDVARNLHRLDAGLIGTYVERHDSGLHVLAAPMRPERSDVVSGEEVSRILQVLRAHYRYIVLDLSKSLSPMTLAAVQDADLVVAVTTAELTSLGSLKRLLPILGRGASKSNPRLRVALNRYVPEGPVTLDDIRTLLDMHVHWTLSNDYQAVLGAATEGKPLLQGRSASPYARDVARMAQDIVGEAALPAADGRKPEGGALKRFFARKGQK